MSVEVRVPPLGESVVSATVGRWSKTVGDTAEQGDVLVELETDKVNLEVFAPAVGVLESIVHNEGDSIDVGDLLATIVDSKSLSGSKSASPSTEPSVVSPPELSSVPTVPKVQTSSAQLGATAFESSTVSGSYSRGRVEERVRMSRRRQVIANNLLTAKRATAMLTTFNEVDMSAVVGLRRSRQESFRARYGVRLGFMSFFTKAVVVALEAYPRVNSELQGETLIIKKRYDIAIAVGADEGLVVPVVRDADLKSFAEIEAEIAKLADRAKTGKLTVEELRGGTFTITNGGIFGNLLSTPILNMPQAGILGLHKMQDRPRVVGGSVVVRPMMYVALSYDHRILDGSEAVRFLVSVKEAIEDPATLLLEN